MLLLFTLLGLFSAIGVMGGLKTWYTISRRRGYALWPCFYCMFMGALIGPIVLPITLVANISDYISDYISGRRIKITTSTSS